MKIKLSKKQWESIGKTAGWKKIATRSSSVSVATMQKLLKELQDALWFHESTDDSKSYESKEYKEQNKEFVKKTFKEARRAFALLEDYLNEEGFNISSEPPRILKFRDNKETPIPEGSTGDIGKFQGKNYPH